MTKRMYAAAVPWIVMMLSACNNEVPDVEATFGTDGLPGDSTGADGSDTNTGGVDPLEVCLPGNELIDPVFYQCRGTGGGTLSWLECNLSGCDQANDEMVAIDFPPPVGVAEPNVQVCCNEALDDEPVEAACIDDCARAACRSSRSTTSRACFGAETSSTGFCA